MAWPGQVLARATVHANQHETTYHPAADPIPPAKAVRSKVRHFGARIRSRRRYARGAVAEAVYHSARPHSNDGTGGPVREDTGVARSDKYHYRTDKRRRPPFKESEHVVLLDDEKRHRFVGQCFNSLIPVRIRAATAHVVFLVTAATRFLD